MIDMTQEDKELLLKDLCARLPYRVKVMKQFNSQVRTLKSIDIENYRVYFVENDVNSPFGFDIEEPLKFHQQIKPYLRPMSSMTEEEKRHISKMMCLRTYDDGVVHDMNYPVYTPYYVMDDCLSYLRSIHVDYSGLIEKGLALEATKGLYKIN